MRTYQSGTKEKKVKRNQKAIYATVLGITVLVVAAIIALSLTLGKPGGTLQTPEDPGKNVEVPPIVPETKPQFVLPLSENYTVGSHAVLDRIVYNSTMGHFRTHNGMDFLAPEGTVVRAITDGKVLSVEHTQLEAGVIKISHANGLVSTYKGLSADLKVEAGDNVKAGDVIGSVAASMPYERSVGSHLHLETTLNNKLVSPLNYLPEIGDK